MIKIAIFSDCFVPQVNGIVTSLFNLAAGLADAGHSVFIVAPKYAKRHAEFEHPNVRVLRIPSAPALFYPEYRITLPFDLAIYATLRDQGVDVIHFEAPLTVALAGIAMARMLKVPVVGTFHTYIADPQYLSHGFPTSKEFQKLAWDYCNFYYNRCDLVTTPSGFTRKELIRHGCTRPISVISNGIDTSMFDNSKADAFRTRHNLSGAVLLFVGRMANEKNIEYLLNATQPVLRSFPDSKLILVGAGPQFHEVHALVHALGLAKSVLMLGNIEHSELVRSGLFGIADVFVTASETENQPMAILEAQANGIPCVGLSEKGIPDLIKDGINGFVVPNHDPAAFSRAVARILADDGLRSSLRAGALREIKKHSLGEVIGVWERTYSKAIKENSR